MKGFGFKSLQESFMLNTTTDKPLTARTLATVCKALDDNTIEQDWLVCFCNKGIRFDLCDFENEVDE